MPLIHSPDNPPWGVCRSCAPSARNKPEAPVLRCNGGTVEVWMCPCSVASATEKVSAGRGEAGREGEGLLIGVIRASCLRNHAVLAASPTKTPSLTDSSWGW